MATRQLPDARDKPIRTFGRTGGRPLSPRRQALVDTRLPTLAVPPTDPGTLNPETLFDTLGPVWLEIGFGGGEHLVAQARANPETRFIGCEPFIEGMAKALSGIDEFGLSNVRLHMDDARDVLSWLAPKSLARCFILFPDPWPKKKQRKRRLIQPGFLNALHAACVPGAQVRFATDVVSYADEALYHFLNHGGFEWPVEEARSWRMPPADHQTTRYEAKRLGDCAPVWFDFVVSGG